MKTGLLILLVATAIACGDPPDESPDMASSTPGSYPWPDYIALFGEKVDDFREGEREPFAFYKEMPACQAVWAALGKAGENGLHELYGFEWFQSGEGSGYDAVFVVCTEKGVTCFRADADLHEARTDPMTVPSHPVDSAVLEKLRARVAAEMPFPIRASAPNHVVDGSIIHDGSYVAVHVYQDGRAHTALWFEPQEGPPRDNRLSVAEHARAYPVHAVLSAIWAAAPPDIFPLHHADCFDLPEDRKWESDDLEVYKRLPAYE